MKTRILLMLLIVPMFAGCTSPYVFGPNPDPNLVAAMITIKKDDFKKQTEFIGPDYQPTQFAPGGPLSSYDELFLRAFKNDEANFIEYQIYVAIDYFGDWRLYDSAYDDDGRRLRILKVYRDISGRSPSEDIIIDIGRQYLDEHRDSGIRLKLYAQSGDEAIFFVPPTYIQAFLSVTQSPPN